MFRSKLGLASPFIQQKLSTYVPVLAYFLLILPTLSWAQNSEAECQEKLTQEQVFQLDVLHGIRTDSTQPAYQSFTVEGERYQAIQLLGYSRARVYLATHSSGKMVVIKDYNLKSFPSDSREHNLFARELEYTAFLLNEGIDVPQILGVEKEKGWFVKEYIEGLFFHELQTRAQLFSFSQEDIQNIKNAFYIVPEQLAIVNKKISSNPNFRQFEPQPLDIKHQNLIYSIRKQKWILFDP